MGRRLRASLVVGALLALWAQSARAQTAIQYVYDELGRLIAVIDPGSDTATYTYDAVGNILSIGRHASTQVSIIAFLPSTGPTGTTVTISGTGFSSTASQNAVTFNGVAATVSSASATQLVVTVPGSATTGSIAVTAPGGSATSSASFTVTSGTLAPTISSFSPTTGVAATTFAIDGTNFSATVGNNRASLNASPLQLTSASTTHLATSVPASTTSGPLRVSTTFGSATSASDFWIAPSGYTASNLEYTARFAGFGGANALTATLSATTSISLLLFDGAPGHRVSLVADNVTFTAAQVSVLSPFGVTLGSTLVGSGGSAFVDQMPLMASGPYTYTVMVKPASGTGHLRVTAYDIAADASGTLVPGGSEATATMSTPGQNGRYTFVGAAGQRVSLRGTADSIALMTVSILNPDGTTLVSPQPWTTSVGCAYI